MNATITLREYLEKKKTFVIPYYQRGYVWGKIKGGGAKDSVSYMIDSLTAGYNAHAEVFIQGVTVSELQNEIILIDGQQRTTFFYLLLKSLGYRGQFGLRYEIREKSKEYLTSDVLLDDFSEDVNEEYQDIYFFKKTLRLINGREGLGKISDRDTFCEYVLDNVKFLYIDIPEEKATKVFTMMNGNKAVMKAEELVKAELLRLASLNDTKSADITDNEMFMAEWDSNMLRSRYAREWDKWLQWWNRDDVKRFFKVDNVMGLLVSTYMNPKQSVSFENFKQSFLSEQKPIEAKKVFDGLRRLQKRFVDAFNDPQSFNRIGAILRISGPDDRISFIRWYLGNSMCFYDKARKHNELDRYYKLAFLGLNHKKITESDNKDIIKEKYDDLYRLLADNGLYNNNKEEAFRLLLRLNIDEDNSQEDGSGRKFDFSIWDNDRRGRSLEHIYPKSKVYHIERQGDGIEVYKNGKDENLDKSKISDKSYISRDSCRWNNVEASEHSIGNLVLLYKDDNSSFNDSPFDEKKAMFFKKPKDDKDKEVKAFFKSRHLLHTIYKFANSTWTGEDIARNKFQTLDEFKEYYKEFMEDYGKE